jgi:predicted DNA-binding protein
MRNILIEKKGREHGLNIFVSYELKRRLKNLALRYDRPMADIARSVLRIGMLMVESMAQAEEEMVREYMELFRKLRGFREI